MKCRTLVLVPHHFAGAGKMIELGKGGRGEVPDFHLYRKAETETRTIFKDTMEFSINAIKPLNHFVEVNEMVNKLN